MKFTYYTIIGKNLNLLSGHIKNVREYAGFNKLKCEKQIIVIVYKNKNIKKEVTAAILKYCKKEKFRTYIYNEPTTDFLENLYACWNLGYELSNEGYVFRGGSDQVFSKDSFVALYNAAEKIRKAGEKKVVLQANTIECKSRILEANGYSRHFMEDFGDTFENFNYKEFEDFIYLINRGIKKELLDISESLRLWKKPTKLLTAFGEIDRVDGCSWLMTKKDFQKYGPMPPLENGITGDVVIHDRLQKAGYKEYIVRDCITYHFVKGESMGKKPNRFHPQVLFVRTQLGKVKRFIRKGTKIQI